MIQIFLMLFLSFLLLLYWLAARRTPYWRKRGIPGPKPAPIKGNLDSVFGERAAVFQLRDWTNIYGKVYGIQEGWRNVLVTSDPEMVRQMMIEKFELFHGRTLSQLNGDVDHTKRINMILAQGKRWKRLRSIATPAFSVTNIKRVMPIIDDSIRVSMDLLEQESANGKPVNLHVFFSELTMDIISRIAMGQPESLQFRTENTKLVRAILDYLNNNIYDYMGWIFPWFGQNVLRLYLLVAGQLIGNPEAILLAKIREVVKQRKMQRDNGKHEQSNCEDKKLIDFIDIFLDSEKDNYRLTNQSGAYSKEEKFERKNTLDEIVMNCYMFLIAGFDTTANSLALICHHLAMHPEIQHQLWEEIDAVWPADDGESPTPTYEQLSQMKYTEAIAKETLRLTPIAANGVSRNAAETTMLGDYLIEKGTTVRADVFTLHRDKSIWGDDAEEFRPERWLEDPSKNNAFYGFGGGPRICIGMRLSMLEVKMILAQLLKRFTIKQCAQTEKELKLSGQLVLSPASVTVRLEPRFA